MKDEEIISALKAVANTYGKPMAINVEKLFRNETRHFASGGFVRTLSPGMEAAAQIFPYGWSSLKNFWSANPNYAPIGLDKQVENSSAMLESRGERTFIKFPNITSAMMSVAELLKLRGGDPGTWFSNASDANGVAARAKYNGELSKIIARFCKTF